MAIWVFRDFLDPRRNNLIRPWIDSLPKKAAVKIDARILVLQGSQIWPEQYVSALKGYEGIYELRIVSNGVQYRPLGTHGPDRREFTLLIGTIEKGGKLPRSDCETAVERRKIIMADRSRTIEHQF